MMFIESMSRRSLGAAVNFAIDKPVIFLLNWLIVLAPFLLSVAVKRKPVIYFLFTVIWAIIGVTDYYILFIFRILEINCCNMAGGGIDFEDNLFYTRTV